MDVSSSEEALALAEHLVEAFSLPFVIDGLEIYSTVSIGIAMAPAASVSSDGSLKKCRYSAISR
jgi:GGDEF domain-containing protein